MKSINIERLKDKYIYNIIAFWAIGMLSHASIWIYKIASTDCNSAGLFHYTPDWEVTLGRWLIPVVDGIRYYLSVPFLVGPIAVLLFAIGTVLVLNILEIKSDIYRYVVGGVLMVTPCIGNTLMFYYCADSYAIAMICACMYVYFIKKKASVTNFAIGTCFLIVSLGLYQAYLGVAAVLCAATLILVILDNKVTEIDIIKKSIYMVASAGVGLIFYYVITRIIISVKNLSLAGYGGADSVASTSLLDIKIAVALSYQKFVHLFFGMSQSKYHTFYRGHYYSWMIFGVFAIVLIIAIINRQIYKRPTIVIIMSVMTLVMPLLCGAIMLIVKGHNIHILMCQGYYVLIAVIASVILNTRYDINNEKIAKAIVIVFITLVGLFGFELSAINNSTYEYNHFIRNNMTTTLNRVLAQAESIEGYTEDAEFAFAGQPLNGYPVESYLEKMAFLEVDTLYDDEYRFNKAMIDNILKEDIGCSIKMCDANTFDSLVSSDEFEKMPVYPNYGSVKMIDKCVLVKFSDEVPMPDKELDYGY